MSLEVFGPEDERPRLVVLRAEGKLDEFPSEFEVLPRPEAQRPLSAGAAPAFTGAIDPSSFATASAVAGTPDASWLVAQPLRLVAASLAVGVLAAFWAGWRTFETPSGPTFQPQVVMVSPFEGAEATVKNLPPVGSRSSRSVAPALAGRQPILMRAASRSEDDGAGRDVTSDVGPPLDLSADAATGPEWASASIADLATLPSQAFRSDSAASPPLSSINENPPSPAVAVASMPVQDSSAVVQNVLTRFQGAYGRLDAAGAKAIWPSVDERALAKAFGNLESQNLTFDSCHIQVGTSLANASCDGLTTYVGKPRHVEQAKRMSWNFVLEKSGDTWQIKTLDIH